MVPTMHCFTKAGRAASRRLIARYQKTCCPSSSNPGSRYYLKVVPLAVGSHLGGSLHHWISADLHFIFFSYVPVWHAPIREGCPLSGAENMRSPLSQSCELSSLVTFLASQTPTESLRVGCLITKELYNLLAAAARITVLFDCRHLAVRVYPLGVATCSLRYFDREHRLQTYFPRAKRRGTASKRKTVKWVLIISIVLLFQSVSAQTRLEAFESHDLTADRFAVVAKLQPILSRLEAAQKRNPAHFRAYAVEREYRLFASEPSRLTSLVLAKLSFTPPSTKTYSIEKAVGSTLGSKIVRQLLQQETRISRNVDKDSAFTRENYVFTSLGTAAIAGQACYLLRLVPRHPSPDLITGRVWIDKRTYLPRLVEGQLSKNPSF